MNTRIHGVDKLAYYFFVFLVFVVFFVFLL